MIATKFEYYKLESLDDAVKLYGQLSKVNKNSFYYSGGTCTVLFDGLPDKSALHLSKK